jgi:hypothetical protein
LQITRSRDFLHKSTALCGSDCADIFRIDTFEHRGATSLLVPTQATAAASSPGRGLLADGRRALRPGAALQDALEVRLAEA